MRKSLTRSPLVFFPGPLADDSGQHRGRFTEEISAVRIAFNLRGDGFDPLFAFTAAGCAAHHGHHPHPRAAGLSAASLCGACSPSGTYDTICTASVTNSTGAAGADATHTTSATDHSASGHTASA